MYPVSIKGVLFSPKREVVLLLNEREEWELPGGRLELGESAPECLAREIFEELSIQVHVGVPVDTYLFERIGLFSPDALPPNLLVGYRRSIDAVRG